MRKKYRILSFLIAILMFLASIDLSLIANAVGTDSGGTGNGITIRDDALHFLVRHWHTDYDPDANYQNEETQKDGSSWFVVVEGYILPNNNDDPDNNYDIYLVNQNSGELEKVSELENGTPYLGKFDKKDGTIELKIKPLKDQYNKDEEIEKFCGFSMSAGRGAVEYNYDADGNPTGITIKYSYYTHLVKGHVFYNSWNKTVPGSADPDLFDSEKYPEIDTAEAFTYAENFTDKNGVNHSIGDIVKYVDEEADKDVVCKTEEDLIKACQQQGITDRAKYISAETTMFYSTTEGLHTNKSLVQDADGRVFLFDLEAWYVEGYAAQIGFILDASGGMAFASNTPSKINVYSTVASRLNIKYNDLTGEYTYVTKSGKKITYKAKSSKENDKEDLKAFIEQLENQVGIAELASVVGDKIGYEFTETHWQILFGKIDGINGELNREGYEYPQRDKLIGYYEIQDNKSSEAGYTNHRTWFLNSMLGNVYCAPSSYVYASTDENDFAKMIAHTAPVSSVFDFISNQVTMTNNSAWGNVPMNFNNVISSNRSFGMNLRNSNAAFVPNVMPTNGKFTISFNVQNTYDTSASFNQKLEILYVGANSGNINDNNFFTMTREGGAIVFYNGYSKNSEPVYKIENVFGTAYNKLDTSIHTVTLSFNGSKVSVYVDGMKKTDITVNIAGNTIVFAPFYNESYISGNNKDTDPLFYLDDIMIYDTALSASEVLQLINSYNDATKGIDDTKEKGTFSWNDVFIRNDIVLSVLLNPRYSANTSLGVSAYSYFVYDANATTKEYAPLTYWNGKSITVKAKNSSGNEVTYTVARSGDGNSIGSLYKFTENGAGWYYLSHGSVDILNAVGTAKTIIGVGNKSCKDYADLPGSEMGETTDGTGREYQSSGNISMPFYIDENGYLRCFFSRSTVNQDVACSYVYELADNDYVKTEALQRVLANFASQISERSPSSLISAVQFSAEGRVPEELVLLDWTNDAKQIASIMSQNRGIDSGKDTFGTGWGYDLSDNGIKQYNYALTGGTFAITGLRAYQNILSKGFVKEAPKFLIVFTDGVDQGDRDETFKVANALKEQDFTIVSVYLPCGPALSNGSSQEEMEKNSEYQQAKEFLTALAGTKNGNDGDQYFFAANELDKLLRIFDEQIMAQISDTIDGYTIKDYIDPRFDLQDSNGTVWHLNANGKVVLGDGTNEFNVTKENIIFHLSGTSTPSARNPYLRYDKEKDMYYLEWVDQTIPSTPIGSKTMLPVWNAEVFLRAKDDFIGGNAIITNGNEENMNWAYHPYDSKNASERAKAEKKLIEQLTEECKTLYDNPSEEVIELYIKQHMKKSGQDASSGFNDMCKQYEKKADGTNDFTKPIDEYPSKGFPRSTVNVRLLEMFTQPLDGALFLGEVISPAQLLTDIENEYITSSYYLEYLKRYAYQRYLYCLEHKDDPEITDELRKKMEEQTDMPLLDLLNEWLSINDDTTPEKSFSIPYMYLPSVKYDERSGKIYKNLDGTAQTIFNSTGTKAHYGDVLGILTYKWEQLEPNGTKRIKDHVKNDTEWSKYSLTVEFTPLREGDSLNDDILDEEGKVIIPALNHCDDDYENNPNAEIFAGYIPIEVKQKQTKISWDGFLFDRDVYVNGRLINEIECDKDCQCDNCLADGTCECDCKQPFKWDPEYKPVVYEQQIEEGRSSYGDAKIINNKRTLTAFSDYTQDIVSGGIALELKLKPSELETALDTDGKFSAKFSLKAIRSFRDTEFAEKLKSENNLDDYTRYIKDAKGNIIDTGVYTFTFEFNYTAEQIKDLQKDSEGYVKMFAKATKVETKFGGGSVTLNELPIGTYQFLLKDAEVDDALSKVKFRSIFPEKSSYQFKQEYFDQLVLNGRNSTNEKDANGNSKTTWRKDKDGNNLGPEINTDNIADFIAEAKADSKNTVATFYIGTSQKTDPERGDLGYVDGVRSYTNNRLGMIVLSTETDVETTYLTIRENGGNENETFFYLVSGKTYDGTEVNLIVSVRGGSSTTVAVPFGKYTVTELSDWAWKYDIDKIEGTIGDWTIPDKTGKTDNTASTEIETPEGVIVTYTHKRNNKPWLGGENFSDKQ